MRVGIPALAGLSILHGLVPPHPGPVAAISAAARADLGYTLHLRADRRGADADHLPARCSPGSSHRLGAGRRAGERTARLAGGSDRARPTSPTATAGPDSGRRGRQRRTQARPDAVELAMRRGDQTPGPTASSPAVVLRGPAPVRC